MTDTPIETPTAHPRWVLPVVGACIVALIVANNVGNVVWASWLETNPLGLIALNSSNKYLLGTSITTEVVPFFVIATIRLMLPDPLFWWLGHSYRDKALNWGRQIFPGMDPIFDQFEGDRTGFKNLLHVLIVIMPNNPVCLLAGVAAIPFRRFIVLSLVGTIGRIAIMRGIGMVFEDQIEDVLDFVAKYQVWLTRGSIVAVLAYVAWQFIGKRGLIGGVETLDEDLGED